LKLTLLDTHIITFLTGNSPLPVIKLGELLDAPESTVRAR